jgi:uncharacterized protein
MLLDDIKQDIMTSLKKGDSVRTETLRFLLAAVRNSAIAKYGAAGETKVTDADVLSVVKTQVKTHRESVEAFEKAGRNELAQKEKDQLAILEVMLPKELGDAELTAIASDAVKSGETNFGKLMGLAMGKVAGRADGGRVSAILKKLLNDKLSLEVRA